ncbi:MAG TPA: helix-turn-helix transcriptional regulator [Burkholderiales bacterium]|nr:helix-turn-helix transcriptional regulator [Burkholderiales bacterium]
MSEPDTFGARLRAARTRANLSQDELARRVKSSKGYISELETDPNIRPSADLVLKLATETGTTVEHLLRGDSPEPGEDRAFFRSYEGADPEVKAKLKAILAVLKGEGTK